MPHHFRLAKSTYRLISCSVNACVGGTLTTHMDRSRCAPWRLEGGLAGFPNRVWLKTDGKIKDDLPNAKILARPIGPNEYLILRGGGGGGFGSPTKRPIEKVHEDVRQGYVSVAAAREPCVVVVNSDTLELDLAASERLRTAMRIV